MSQAQLALKTGQAKLWILLVGVSQYHDRRFPILQYSTIDTQQLADAFVEATQEFPETCLKVHHDSALPPTLSAVRSSLQDIVAAAQPQDTVLIYFAGHGALDARLQQVVFCLADTQKAAMLQTGLSAISLLGALGNCTAKQQIVWIDACHANGLMPQTDTPELLDNPTWQLIEMFQQQASRMPGFQALLSCDRAQQSWKFPELGHGLFTHFLIEGLRGGAANPQGIVMASVLANYVHDRTVQHIDRTNQQLQWLHRDDKTPPLKAIAQKPVRIGNAQVPMLAIGIRPKDPLEYLFSETKEPDLQPPLSRSVSLRKPKRDASEQLAPPPIQKPTLIEPAISLSPRNVPESDPLIEVESESSSAIQWPDRVPPKAQEPIAEFLELSEPEESSLEPVESLPEIEERPIASVQPEAEAPICPALSAPAPEAIIPQPASRKRSATQRQIQRLHQITHITKKRLHSATIVLNGAVREVSQSVGDFATSQRAHTKRQVAHLSNAISTKLNSLTQSTHQAAKTSRTLYRQRVTDFSQIATDAADSTRNLTRSANTLWSAAAEHAQKPQTRQLITTTLKSIGFVAIGVAGLALYIHRNDQIHEVQTLSSAAATQIQANQATEALRTALKAGHALQQADRPWTFVPESLKLSTIATLQQALSLTEAPATPVGDALSNAALSPNQTTFAATTPKNTIQIWQRSSPPQQTTELRKTELSGHKATITKLAFSPDGKRLASASEDNMIKLWNVEKGILIQTLSAHTQAVTALSFRSDGEVLASGSADQTIKLWGVAKGQILDTFKGHNATAHIIRFSPDGRILAAATLTNTIHLWYPDSQNPVLLGRHSQTQAKPGIHDLAFSPDGKAIASAGADKTIKLWNVGAAKAARETLPTQTLTGHENEVTSLSFSASGKILASGGRDRTIRLWDMQHGTFIQTLFGSPESIEQLAFRTDGKALVSLGDRYGLHLWSLDLNSLMQTGCQLINNRSQTGCS